MGLVESAEADEHAPPPPLRSTLFVLRNGRYEPQNLMPMIPRSDVLDFDGFVVRRGTGSNGVMAARPPDMRQAALIKSSASLRRDSFSVEFSASDSKKPDLVPVNDADPFLVKAVAVDEEDPVEAVYGEAVRFRFKIDAIRPFELSVHVLMFEMEETDVDGQGPSSIVLVPDEDLGAQVDAAKFEPGLDQAYESCLVDLARWPASSLAYSPDRPKNIPVLVRLEAAAAEGEPSSVQYTYVSLQRRGGASDEGPPRSDLWSSQVFAQKLQYGYQCFTLHEVFGVGAKTASLDAVGEDGNPECVICLSEPRDTAVLPCRHMCFCSYCAGIVRLQCDRCPVCRQKVSSLLQFKRGKELEEEKPSPVAPLSSASSLAHAPATPTGQEALLTTRFH